MSGKDSKHIPAPTHYLPSNYLSPQRMGSVALQVSLVKEHFPKAHTLEIGVGSGLSSHLLNLEKVHVTTFDFDRQLHPAVVGSIANLPFRTNAFDCFLCCQVLEHLPWPLAAQSLKELARVCRSGGVLSVPTVKRMIGIYAFGPRRDGMLRIPLPSFFKMNKREEKEHYWKLGVEVAEKTFRRQLVASGFEIVTDFRPATWLYHHFFVVRKAAL